MTTIEELKKIISTGESETLEFKKTTGQKYDAGKTLCGMVNSHGGMVIFGVSNTGEMAGQEVVDKTLRDLAEEFRKFDPPIHPQLERLTVDGNKELIVVTVSRAPVLPVAFDGRFYERRLNTTSVMPRETMERFVLGQAQNASLYEIQLVSEYMSVEDALALLEVSVFFDLLKQPMPTSTNAALEKLSSEKMVLVENNRVAITLLGAVLFAKQLNKFEALRDKGVRVITYKGTNKIDAEKDLQGNKGYAAAFSGLVDYISGQLPSNELIQEAFRKEVTVYPAVALRELIANAIIHQDFSIRGTRVTIEIFKDRIEISNPGQPLIDERRFIDEYQSRNERLAGLMRRIGICEERGSGIDRVISLCEVYQLPAPDFRVSDHRTTVVLFCPMDFSKMTSKDRVRAAYQHCCLKYVSNERMTNQSLRERFKVDEKQTDTVSRIIRDAQDEGLVKLEDPENASKRYARYLPYWA
jgi:ATP-dependent DNA helicase RecG